MLVSKLKKMFAKNYRYFIVGGLFIALIVILIIFLSTRGTDVATTEESGEGIVTTNVDVPKDKYEVDAYSNVNALVTSYLDAMGLGNTDQMSALSNALTDERKAFFEAQSKYIGNYSDYHFYTKKGPEENSFIVLATYDLMVKDDVTKIPGLLSLYVCTDSAGKLYINNDTLSSDDEAYILAIVSQDDFKKLQEEVQLEYNNIMDSNAELQGRVSEIRTSINSDVQTSLEALKKAETEQTAAQDEETAKAEKEANAVEVRVTGDNINVRESASSEATVLGKANKGDVYKRYEQLENGWSKIAYTKDGQETEAYISSDYVEVVSNSSEETSSEASNSESTEGGRKAGDEVTVKEGVNVRSSASKADDSNIIGKAVAGTKYKLIEEKDGWCKITYEGKDAFIKSDFVE